MLDINLIRDNADAVKARLSLLGDASALERVDQALTLDQERRQLILEAETLQAHRNKLNKSFGQLRGNKTLDGGTTLLRAVSVTQALQARDYDEAVRILEGERDSTLKYEGETLNLNAAFELVTNVLRKMGDAHNALTQRINDVEARLRDTMLFIPNLPHESTLVGASEADNRAWTPEGTLPTFDFTPKPHWELASALGIIDFERGVRMSGSRFYVLRGDGARLQRALASFFLDMARAKGFEELYVPYLVQEGMMEGAGQFPKFRDVVYSDPDADLYLLPTAEVAITNMHRDEILDEAQLPLYYVAQTPCFRREQTSAGKDVRGIKRVHQFEKVEMYKFTTPETSYAELESLVEAASDIARALELPFRRLEIATGDLGFSATKKYDLEIWAAGCEEWLEVSSCSNTEDFQARRAMIRYRTANDRKIRYVHTLNGSGLALPRVMIAIMENNQQADGSIIIPPVLRPYMGGQERIGE
jgi:seryl-tRNA synthetase